MRHALLHLLGLAHGLEAAEAVRGHWGIENPLHWVLDVVFKEDPSRLRKGHDAVNMVGVRHFAINLVHHTEIMPPQRSGLRHPRKNPARPKPSSLELRREMAGWDTKSSNRSSKSKRVNPDSEPWTTGGIRLTHRPAWFSSRRMVAFRAPAMRRAVAALLMAVLTLAGVGRGLAAGSALPSPAVAGILAPICHSDAGSPAAPADPGKPRNGDCCDQCALGAAAILSGAPEPSSALGHAIRRAAPRASAARLARTRSPRQSQGPPAA